MQNKLYKLKYYIYIYIYKYIYNFYNKINHFEKFPTNIIIR